MILMNKKEIGLPLRDNTRKSLEDIFEMADMDHSFDYIFDNLKHDLRGYQKDGLYHYHASQSSPSFKFDNINHVLFHMATGSGKTDLMAALILYMFHAHGYQNFIFTVNATPILNKTFENLFNKVSKKYLFNSPLEIEGRRIYIKAVDSFPKTIINSNTIYIKMVSIQKLSRELATTGENTMTVDDYAKNKVVILGDEAHHYSRNTKVEKETEQTWEYAINTILNAREENRLLEFTATIDLEDTKILNKYKDKIIYQYTISQFIEDRYSKNIRRIQSPNNDLENMLNAVLLSERRRLLALYEYDITFKPVILFKSQRIAHSKQSEKKFNEMIERLTPEYVLDFISKQTRRSVNNKSAVLLKAYEFYKETPHLSRIIEGIKQGFNPNRVLNANDTSNSQMLEKGDFDEFNTLERPDNLKRVIFAVAKLTEGWDVLNLYDIVRISDPDKVSNKRPATNSEAQLIGRGARYNPFKYQGETSYSRRFTDGDWDSLFLETLHYHTINESNYIKNLLDSLNEMNIPTGLDVEQPLLDIKLKNEFKKTSMYKHGQIFYNESVSVSPDYYDSLKKYGFKDQPYVVQLRKATEELNYDQLGTMTSSEGIKTVEFKLEKRFVYKAMDMDEFYKFSNLKHYLPLLESIKTFLGSNWLDIDNHPVHVQIPQREQFEDLTLNDKLDITSEYLTHVKQVILKGFKNRRGTGRFIGLPIRDYVVDYQKRKPLEDTRHIFTGGSTQKIRLYDTDDFKGYDSFVYDSSMLNLLEKEFLDRVNSFLSNLNNQRFEEVYIIRMDENMHRDANKNNNLKLYQFDNNPREYHNEAFQPDFIILLKEQNYVYQIFVDPKGSDRLLSDKWKEELLLFINDSEEKIEIKNSNTDVKIKGARFYTSQDEQKTIEHINTLIDE